MISCPENYLVRVLICDVCVEICNNILDDEYEKSQVSKDYDNFYDELASSLFPK